MSLHAGIIVETVSANRIMKTQEAGRLFPAPIIFKMEVYNETIYFYDEMFALIGHFFRMLPAFAS